MKKGKLILALGLALALVGPSEAQQKKAQKGEPQVTEEEFQKIVKEGHTNDPRVAWKLEQDELQKLCSKYKDRSGMPAKDLQRVIELSKQSVKFPDWGLYWGNIENGKKIVRGSTGRNVPYGFSDKPGGRGTNCYACHQIEKNVVGGNVGPSLTGYGKRWGITKENLNSPETWEKVKTVYSIIYNSWSVYPCSAMPRYGYHGVIGANEAMDIVTYLLHPDSPVNK